MRGKRTQSRRLGRHLVYRQRRIPHYAIQPDVPIRHCILDNEKTICPICINEQPTERGVFWRENRKWFRCSRCEYEYPADTWTEAQRLHRDLGERSETGDMHEEDFEKHWTYPVNGLSYRDRFGPLERSDREDKRKPDFYNQTLKTYFEVKGKDCPWKYIKRDGTVHVNKYSLDSKADQQQSDRENLYLFVEFLETSPGWFSIPALDALEASKGKTIQYTEGASGSRKPSYAVPFEAFKRLREAVEQRAKEPRLS